MATLVRNTHAAHAFKVFIDNNHFSKAYLTLLHQIDLIYIGRERYNLTDSFDLDELVQIKTAMEKEYEFDGELSIPNLLERKKEEKSEDGHSMKFLIGLNEEQLDTIAEMLMQSKKYPYAKKEHVITEMKSYQLFYERCKNPDIIVQQKQYPAHETYAYPVSFILQNRLTDVISTSDNDMDRLLRSWGY